MNAGWMKWNGVSQCKGTTTQYYKKEVRHKLCNYHHHRSPSYCYCYRFWMFNAIVLACIKFSSSHKATFLYEGNLYGHFWHGRYDTSFSFVIILITSFINFFLKKKLLYYSTLVIECKEIFMCNPENEMRYKHTGATHKIVRKNCLRRIWRILIREVCSVIR